MEQVIYNYLNTMGEPYKYNVEWKRPYTKEHIL